jgi:hypothetical protein
MLMLPTVHHVCFEQTSVYLTPFECDVRLRVDLALLNADGSPSAWLHIDGQQLLQVQAVAR